MAYILDTNVLSEIYATKPNENFRNWFIRQEEENLHTTTLNIAELRFGIEKLPPGKKREGIEHWLTNLLLHNFKNRILSFDLKSARAWGAIMAYNKKIGTPRPHMDCLLAAIASAHDMVLVTRNSKDFAGLDIPLVNPFDG